MSNQESIRVLIAEDDHLVSEMIRGLLEEAGYTVVGKAANGLETVEMTESLQPDVVLMDIKMPDMDGIEATRLIYERCPTPVVVLTAHETEELIERASTAGAGAYLVKPSNAREIERAIAIALARFGDLMEQRRLNVELQAEIAERKRTEEALRESEERFRTIFETAQDSIFIKDRASRYTQVNPAMERLFGFPASRLVGRTDEDIFGKEAAAHIREMDTYVLCGEVVEEEDTRPVGGVPTTFHVIKVPMRNSSGEVIGLCGIARDITERKRAEEALREYSERLEEMVEARTQELRGAQEELIRNERLAVLGQLADGVAHELRNPLGAISNATYFLNMVLEEPSPEVKEALEILSKEVGTSEKVISSLINVARAKLPTRREVDLNDVLRWTLSRIAVPENVEVVRQLDETLPTIQADPDQLIQIFGNTILNGIQAMTEGGRLVVRTFSDEPLEALSPEWVAVSFTDTGVGISEENLERLFEPLFTTKAKGIGLGLTLAKTLVEGHRGSIEVQSEVGKGSTFTIKLPLAETKG